MVIQHNRMSQNAGRQLHSITAGRGKLSEKLSSGFWINRAADDAAGLTISESLRHQIRGLNRASQNAEDGISLIQTAEGGLGEVHNILKRMRELSVQAANDTNTEEDRNAIQFEIDDLVEEVDRIAETTQYNTMNLLDGNLSGAGAGKLADDGGIVPLGADLDSWARASAKLSDFKSGNIDTYMMDDTAAYVDLKDSNGPILYRARVLNNIFMDMSVFMIAEDIRSSVTALWNGNGGSFQGKETEAFQCMTNGLEKMLRAMGQPGVYSKTLPQYAEAKASLAALNAETDPAGLKTKLADFNEKIKELYEESSSGLPGPDNPTKYTTETYRATVGMSTLSKAFGGLLDNPAGVSLADLTDSLDKFQEERKADIVDHLIREDRDKVKQMTSSAQMLSYFKVLQIYRLNAIGGGGGGAADGPRGALMLQAGAQAGQGIGISIESVKSDNLGLTGLRVTSHPLASQAITTCDQAIERVSGTRSRLGALQNRLEHTVSTLRNTGENTQMAESRIRDTDMAKTMSEYARANILSQAGQAVLAQANSSQEGILSLLQ